MIIPLDLIGYMAAGFLTTASFLPQAIHDHQDQGYFVAVVKHVQPVFTLGRFMLVGLWHLNWPIMQSFFRMR